MRNFKKTVMALAFTLLPMGVSVSTAAPVQVVTVPTVAVAAPTPTVETLPAVVDVALVKEINTPVEKPAGVCGKKEPGLFCLQSVYRDFMNKKHWPMSGKTPDGKSFYFGTASVLYNRSQPGYIKALAMAYDEAYLKAVKKFSSAIMTETKTKTVISFFKAKNPSADDFVNPEESGQGRTQYEALITKALKLGEAKLNEGLRQLGVDPEEFSAIPPDQKKRVLEKKIDEISSKRTALALGGINVVQNFIRESADGKSHVGVIIAYSPRIEGMARALRTGEKPAIQAVGQSLDLQIPNDSNKLLDTYGPRLMVDEEGPVVVSFGFWSPDQGPEEMADELLEAAMMHADQAATNQIARFISLSYSSTDETTKALNDSMTKTKSGKDGGITQAVDKTISDMVESEAIAKTSARLQGLKTIRNWYGQDVDGHAVVGVVKSYSFASQKYAREITQDETAPAADNGRSQDAAETKKYDSQVRGGSVGSAIDVF